MAVTTAHQLLTDSWTEGVEILERPSRGSKRAMRPATTVRSCCSKWIATRYFTST